MIELAGLYPEEMADWLRSAGEKPFRAGQIFSWLARGRSFDEMTDLSLSLRQKLKEGCVDTAVKIVSERVSALDGTRKLLFEMRDGNCVEGVLMRYHYGCTLCISTQVGCRMGCRFCASTLDGRVRDLTAAEMLGEVTAVNRLLEADGSGVRNIVLMGSGEPLDNYDEVVRFLRLVGNEKGVNIGMRRISLSTCGLVPGILRFSQEQLPVTLSISLHAPSDEIRKKLMPIALRYSIREVLDACRVYLEKTGRRIIFEYALIDGVNSGREHAAMLADLVRGMQCHVNVIPLNDVPERDLRGVSEKQVSDFLEVLASKHISATRRREMGDDIEGACGQLRKKFLDGGAQ